MNQPPTPEQFGSHMKKKFQFQMVVMSVLQYGSITWTLTKHLEKKNLLGTRER